MRKCLGRAAALVAVAVVSVACTFTIGEGAVDGSPSPSSAPSERPSPVPTGPGSAAAAMRALCVPPKMGSSDPVTPGETPSAIAEVEDQVEAVRGFPYEHAVAVNPITQAQMAAKLTQVFDATYPKAFYDRRTLAWRTIGVIGPQADLRGALLAFQTGQVIGFYNPENGELVYIGDESLNLSERFVLAHELTHAIDDQRFDLKRIDPLVERCQDERFQAALGAVEGSAQYFAYQVITQFPGGTVGSDEQPSLAGIPPFLVAMELWPYTAGQSFMTAMEQRGGTDGLDQALEDLPASTEQVMHPERYPSDVPTPLDIPDRADELGTGWRDLDVMQVGEEFLHEMLALRLDATTASDAAAGWDGGLYRAWSDGTHTAVVLTTAWDSAEDAEAFAAAAKDWLAAGDTPGAVLQPDPQRVTLVFSDDPAALTALSSPA
jgi:hypothetical protein